MRLDTGFCGALCEAPEPIRPFPNGEVRQFASLPVGRYWLSAWGQAGYAACGNRGIAVVGRLFDTAALIPSSGEEDPAPPGPGPPRPPDNASLLLLAYRRWGPTFPRYVEGQFAFALWDNDSERLLLGRGPTDSQPLYYARFGSGMLFATGVRALLALPRVRARLNEAHIARWLAMIPGAAHTTFFEGISYLPPGQVLNFQKGRVALDGYWRPAEKPLLRLRDSREYADGLRDVLERAVRDRLPAAAAVATHLSGGLDSSSVTATAAGLLGGAGRRLFAFTAAPTRAVAVPGKFTDEAPHAAAVAAMHPNVDHIIVRHGAHPLFPAIDRISAAQMEPIVNPMNYDWLYEISLQARRRGAGVLLVGLTGNMTVSYDGAEALSDLFRRGRLRTAARLACDLHGNGRHSWRGLFYSAMRPVLPIPVRHLIDQVTGRDCSTARHSLMRTEFASANGVGAMALESYYRRRDSRSLRLSIMRRLDLGAMTDALSRAGGVRLTDPTADRRVVEYCLAVPAEYYCEKGVPRSLIRNAMIGRLPEQVRTESCKGLPSADFAFHFRRELPEAFAEVARMRNIDLAARVLDLHEIERLLQQLEARGAEPGWFEKGIGLQRALSLGRFIRRFEDGTLF